MLHQSLLNKTRLMTVLMAFLIGLLQVGYKQVFIISYFVALPHIVHSEEFEDYDEYEDYNEDEEDYESDLPFVERSFRAQSNSIFDLMDEERDRQLKPEDFMYPFDAKHTPMLSQNLVDTIQGVSSSFINTRKVIAKKNRALKNRGTMTRLGKQPKGFGNNKDSSSKKGKSGKNSKSAPVKVPDFDISGTFGTQTDAYVVIGQRYYTIGDRLKGSRDLRRVVVLGIDDQFAYFNYKDHKFVKKIKALESVF